MVPYGVFTLAALIKMQRDAVAEAPKKALRALITEARGPRIAQFKPSQVVRFQRMAGIVDVDLQLLEQVAKLGQVRAE